MSRRAFWVGLWVGISVSMCAALAGAKSNPAVLVVCVTFVGWNMWRGSQ